MNLILKELTLCLLISIIICDVKVNVKVLSPTSLQQLKFPEIQVGYFGQIPYGKKIISEVVIPKDSSACTISESEQSTIILAHDGNCSADTKALNAQILGATVLIIISETPKELTGHMSGKVATILLSGEDALLLEETAKEEGQQVVVSVGFGKPMGREQSNVEFWMDSTGIEGYQFLQNIFFDWRIINMVATNRIVFKPRYTIYYCSQCIADGFISDNSNCISGGRYCSPDPDQIDGHNGPVTGRDAVNENLRQICIYKSYWGKSYIDWLNYEQTFYEQCVLNLISKPDDFDFKACGDNIIKTLNLNQGNEIQNCIDNSFESDGTNKLLHKEMSSFVGEGIQIWPSLYINDLNFRGDLEDIDYVVQVICKSISNSNELEYCFGTESEKSNNDKGVSVFLVIVLVIITLLLTSICMYFIYQRKIKKELQEDFQIQISTAISQYIALSEQPQKK